MQLTPIFLQLTESDLVVANIFAILDLANKK